MFVLPGTDVKEDEGQETHSVCVFLPFICVAVFLPPQTFLPSQAIRQTFRCTVFISPHG